MVKLPNLKFWSSRDAAKPVSSDPLGAFASEDIGLKTSAGTNAPTDGAFREIGRVVGAAVTILVIAIGAGLLLHKSKATTVEAASGTLRVESVPSGADIYIGGVHTGKTPRTFSVPQGEHNLEVVHEGKRRTIRAAASAGVMVVHHVQLDVARDLPVVTKAALRVITEPARLRVLVDGTDRGASPVTVEGLAAGSHKVQVVGGKSAMHRTVDIAPGERASLFLSAASTAGGGPAGPPSGWLSVVAEAPLQISEGAEIVGTTRSAKILMPAGRHELQFVNEALGFAARRSVQVTAGTTTQIRLELPTTSLSINALPWAEVWVDGTRLGETPIGNYQVRIGTHEVIFRHPELGERRQTVTVSLIAPARVSVDLRKAGL